MGIPPTPTHAIANRYRLLDRLGSGGMGTVWRGKDELLGRIVAVKELQPPTRLDEVDRAVMRERTLREARAAARLSHPNAVTVYDVVEEDGRPWIVMELLDSRSLAQVIRTTGPVSPRRAAGIGLDVLSALEAAHAAGIVHRDVKPGNVMISDDGRAVLTDFGIATLDGDSHLTTTGLLVGAPAYVAPERARGDRPGPASDLWALGATLYAAVEGRPPFDRDSAMATLSALMTEDIPPAGSAGPLAPVLDGLLVKDPARRLSARQARQLLQRARLDAEEPTVSTRPQPTVVTELPADRTEVVERPQPPAPELPQLPPPVRQERVRPRRRPRIGALLAGLLVVAAAVAVPVALTRPDRPSHSVGAPASRPTPSPTPAPSHARSATPSPKPSAKTPPTTTKPPARKHPAKTKPRTGAGLPAGFRTYHDTTGFSVAVPAGWQRVRDGSRVDFRDPAGGRFLRIDQTDSPQPDPVADWRRQAAYVSKRLPGYRTVSITAADYRGYPAADWQFEFGAGGDRRIRVVDRGFTVDGKGYAIYWSAPAARWASSLDDFHTFAKTFQPA